MSKAMSDSTTAPPAKTMSLLYTLSKSFFLAAAGLSFLLSIYLWFVLGSREQGIFVGLWVPSILSLGTLVMTDRKGVHHD